MLWKLSLPAVTQVMYGIINHNRNWWAHREDKDNIKVSVVCLYLSHAPPMCTMITADSTAVYSVFNRVLPVIVCYKSGIILLNFSPKLSLFRLQPASKMQCHLDKGTSFTPDSFALLPQAWYLRRWCDFAGWQWP